MTNYTLKARTNYFRVADSGKFLQELKSIREDMRLIYCPDSELDKYYTAGSASAAGIPVIEFREHEGQEGSFAILMENGLSGKNTLGLCEVLQKNIIPGDACIITEIGYEKTECLTGSAVVITRKDTKFLSLEDYSLHVAGMMLGNTDWVTKMDY